MTTSWGDCRAKSRKQIFSPVRERNDGVGACRCRDLDSDAFPLFGIALYALNATLALAPFVAVHVAGDPKFGRFLTILSAVGSPAVDPPETSSWRGAAQEESHLAKRREASPPYRVCIPAGKGKIRSFRAKIITGYQDTHPRRLRSEAHSSLSSTPESAPSMRRAMGALRMQRGPAETAFRPCAIVPGFFQTGRRNPPGCHTMQRGQKQGAWAR